MPPFLFRCVSDVGGVERDVRVYGYMRMGLMDNKIDKIVCKQKGDKARERESLGSAHRPDSQRDIPGWPCRELGEV